MEISAQEKKDTKETINDTIENGNLRVLVNQPSGFIKTTYTNSQNVYLNNSIRFADTKAGALVAVNGLIGKFVFDVITSQQNLITQIILGIGLLFLFIGIGLSIWVVFPRAENRKDKGIIYWGNIVNMNQEEYIEAVETMDAKEIRREGLISNYIQSRILTDKFKYLSKAFSISLIGYSILIVFGIVIFILDVYRQLV